MVCLLLPLTLSGGQSQTYGTLGWVFTRGASHGSWPAWGSRPSTRSPFRSVFLIQMKWMVELAGAYSYLAVSPEDRYKVKKKTSGAVVRVRRVRREVEGVTAAGQKVAESWKKQRLPFTCEWRDNSLPLIYDPVHHWSTTFTVNQFWTSQ